MTFRVLITAILLATTSNAFAAGQPVGCEKWLKAVTTYEKMSKGKIVWRFDTFNFGNWDPNSQFTAAVLIQKVEKASLEASFTSDDGKKNEFQTYSQLAPFELDPRLKEFDDFKPKQFFRFEQAGRFTLRLKSGSTVLCTHTGKYGFGD